jgi:hypothetical protein
MHWPVGFARPGLASLRRLRNNWMGLLCGGASMAKPDPGFDFDRYRKLLAEATDEPKRVALIELLVIEGARAKLAASRSGIASGRISGLPKRPNGGL